MNRLSTISFLISLIFVATTCREDPPKPPQRAECDKGFLPCEEDSTICCEVLCPPGHLLGGPDSTECLPVECPEFHHLCGVDSTECCLDTTSHDMTWEVDTIFTGFSSSAYDVAIINDTTIWVVGKFLINDPQDTMTYEERSFNLIEWNGKEWEPKPIHLPDGSKSGGRLTSIFAINETNIWIGSVINWDGTKFTFYTTKDGWPDFEAYTNEIWASGPNDVFFISDKGMINHWDGSKFTRMDTPTDNLLMDIWGTGPEDVWAIGYNPSEGVTVLIHYDGDKWSLMFDGDINDWYANNPNKISGVIKGVWTNQKNEVKIVSNPNGIYQTTLDSAPKANLISFDHYGVALEFIRGNHFNDIYISGNNSGIFHYNGNSVYKYNLPGSILGAGLDVKEDLVVQLGEVFEFVDGGNKIIVFRGKKL